MAEIELNVLKGQCLNRRIDDIEIVRKEVNAWQEHRNNKTAKVHWQFVNELHEANSGRSIEVDIKRDLTVYADRGLIEIA